MNYEFNFDYRNFVINFNQQLNQKFMKESILKTKSFSFAVETINLCKKLNEEKEYVISKQLLRSGTSIGANIREAKNALSLADFVHKLYISQKECDESMYWLELLVETNYISEAEFRNIYSKSNELLKMLKSSILTTKSKLK